MDAHPQHMWTFGDDAIEELALATAALPKYHRPRNTSAGVRERIGMTHIGRGLVDAGRRELAQAVTEWAAAEKLIEDKPGPTAADIEDERDRVRVRRLLCLLRTAEPGARDSVVQEIRHRPPAISGSFRTLYNAACLYAALGGDYLPMAYEMLGRSVLSEQKADLRRIALADADINFLPGLGAFLDGLVGARRSLPAAVCGDEALGLIHQVLDGTADAQVRRSTTIAMP
jgi:hypothetical protein